MHRMHTLNRHYETTGRATEALLALLIAVLLPVLAHAAPTGRQIMEAVDARDDGDREIRDMEMLLIDKRGNRRTRTIRWFRREDGADDQTVLFYLAPADVKDTGLLTYDYDAPERDDDQWLYLPALEKTKRIAAGDKSGSFMGSDFSYADMTSREVDRYTYRLMEEGEVNGTKVWQVEGIPNAKEMEETGYTKSILFVRQDNDFVIRSVHWVKKGKRLKYFDVKKLELIDDVWVATEAHMTTKLGKATLHKTVIRSHNVRFDQDLDPDDFTVRKLEAGP